jgi:surfeit locus 1 family protein
VRRLVGNIGIRASELEAGVLVEVLRERQVGFRLSRISRSRRLSTLFATALTVSAACVALGIWQIARLHQKQQFNAAVRAGLAESPRPLEDLLSGGVDPDTVRFRRVTATGTFDAQNQVELYGRTQGGRPGSHLLTPLVSDDGSAVIVDRGWIPLGLDPTAKEPPTGHVEVEGVLFASEGDPPGRIGAATERVDTLVRVDLARIQTQLPYRIAPVYVLLQDQATTRSGELPIPAPLPELSEGPHLSYAVQWFSFATIALVGSVVVALREGRGRAIGRKGHG